MPRGCRRLCRGRCDPCRDGFVIFGRPRTGRARRAHRDHDGITESTLTNVDHGDESGPSSIGVFQQMTSWGSLAQRTDPAQAAGLFFDRMVHVPDWESIDPWMAAQAVQESEFSDGSNYQSHVNQAQSITSALLVTATPGGDRRRHRSARRIRKPRLRWISHWPRSERSSPSAAPVRGPSTVPD